VAKKHNKDVRFEIDVVEDLLPVDVDEGAMRGKGIQGEVLKGGEKEARGRRARGEKACGGGT
jgi:hypothetical protein